MQAEPQTPSVQIASKASKQQTARHEEAVDELVMLLAAGHLSPGMRQFISSSLGESSHCCIAKLLDESSAVHADLRLLTDALCVRHLFDTQVLQ